MRLIKKADGWYNLYDGEIGIGSTHEDLQGYKLSKQNCDEIFGIVDVEKLAKNDPNGYYESDYQNIFVDGFINGFNKAMELYQPTEIEVEIEMEVVNHCDCQCHTDGVTMHFMACCNPDIVPKLDENNNLILRKWS